MRQGARRQTRKPGTPTDGGIPTDLGASLRSTRDGLEALFASLVDSGLEQAIAPYREMQRVLILQRAWSTSHAAPEDDRLWSEIAATARLICGLLRQFSASLEVVSKLDGAASGGSGQRHAGSDVLAALARSASMSPRRIAEALGQSLDDIELELTALVAAGVVRRRGWGRGVSYSIPDAVVTSLVSTVSLATVVPVPR